MSEWGAQRKQIFIPHVCLALMVEHRHTIYSRRVGPAAWTRQKKGELVAEARSDVKFSRAIMRDRLISTGIPLEPMTLSWKKRCRHRHAGSVWGSAPRIMVIGVQLQSRPPSSFHIGHLRRVFVVGTAGGFFSWDVHGVGWKTLNVSGARTMCSIMAGASRSCRIPRVARCLPLKKSTKSEIHANMAGPPYRGQQNALFSFVETLAFK
jgi:hypothetical protein